MKEQVEKLMERVEVPLLLPESSTSKSLKRKELHSKDSTDINYNVQGIA